MVSSGTCAQQQLSRLVVTGVTEHGVAASHPQLLEKPPSTYTQPHSERAEGGSGQCSTLSSCCFCLKPSIEAPQKHFYSL